VTAASRSAWPWAFHQLRPQRVGAVLRPDIEHRAATLAGSRRLVAAALRDAANHELATARRGRYVVPSGPASDSLRCPDPDRHQLDSGTALAPRCRSGRGSLAIVGVPCCCAVTVNCCHRSACRWPPAAAPRVSDACGPDIEHRAATLAWGHSVSWPAALRDAQPRLPPPPCRYCSALQLLIPTLSVMPRSSHGRQRQRLAPALRRIAGHAIVGVRAAAPSTRDCCQPVACRWPQQRAHSVSGPPGCQHRIRYHRHLARSRRSRGHRSARPPPTTNWPPARRAVPVPQLQLL